MARHPSPARRTITVAPPGATLRSPAAQAGHDAGRAVLDGLLPVEAAGRHWQVWADRSHLAGEQFLRAFDATGAQR
jgi:hypothetical protein